MKALLKEMKDYIEDAEEAIDGEWGRGRMLDQLIKDGAMPELYTKVLIELSNQLAGGTL